MANIGSGPIFSVYVGQGGAVTIAASMAGTAAATQLISSASFAYARGMEVYNQTTRNLELFVGNDRGVTAYQNVTIGGNVFVYTGVNTTAGVGAAFFCPGTASSTVSGRVQRFPMQFEQGYQLWVRTTENTPITCSSTTPLIINFWA